jgi:WD40 repeat protein
LNVNAYTYRGAVAFSADETLLAASTSAHLVDGSIETRVHFWDTATWSALHDLSGVISASTVGDPLQGKADRQGYWEEGIVAQIAFAHDGRTTAMNGWQRTIPVWEVASGKERLLLEGHQESTVCVAYANDGRTLASASWDDTIRLWDLQTGKELRRLKGHRGKANSLVFTKDGSTLISQGDDATVLFWDVAAQTHRPSVHAGPVTVRELEPLWDELASADAPKAYRAMIALCSAPAEAVSFLSRHLQPATSIDPRQVSKLIADLDSDRFAERSNASAELERLGDIATGPLNKKLAESSSPESRERIKLILKNSYPVRSPSILREIRAVEVLEKIGTQPAQQLLQALAAGAASARLTKEASSALGRLTRDDRASRSRVD